MISKRHLVGNSAWHGGVAGCNPANACLLVRWLSMSGCAPYSQRYQRAEAPQEHTCRVPVPDLDLVNAYGDGSRDEAKPVDRISETSLPHAARAGGHPCRLDHAGLIGCPARRAGHREVFSPWSLEQACERFLRR